MKKEREGDSSQLLDFVALIVSLENIPSKEKERRLQSSMEFALLMKIIDVSTEQTYYEKNREGTEEE